MSRFLLRGCALALTAALLVPTTATAAATQWQRVGSGITEGVSGLAVLSARGDRLEALSVVDNKKAGQDRARRMVFRAGEVTAVRTLTWAGETPVDLEAVTRVPGRSDEFVAVASDSRAFHLRVKGDVVSVLAAFDLPGDNTAYNMESFALHAAGSRLVAVWADRGAGTRASTLFSAYFSVRDHGFGKVTSVQYRTAGNDESVRHASDIAITGQGSLLISSAVDPGDDGPFTSSLREAGRLVPRQDTVSVELSKTPRLLGTFDGHKIEAVTLTGGRDVLLGTDDENDGGWVALD
ncbi:hypothetical protein ACIA8G_12275 [Lentzea sp. NPDC051213]|uniref:hypothetical protein n=1 Tax=Lentzea sp. NPDC051213 TaxID=3364126 RepID=UPI00379E104E